MALIKQTSLMKDDWSGRCETPVGVAGGRDPTDANESRRLTARPTESERPGVEIYKSAYFN